MVARSPKEVSRRSSKAWDCSRLPSRGILKKPSFQVSHACCYGKTKIEKECEQSNLSKMMDSLTLVAHSKPVVTEVKKLYQSFEYEETYDESTILTVKFSLTKERLDALKEAKNQLTFSDIFEIPDIIDMVLDKAKDDIFGLYNTFYCDAYWLIKYVDIIVNQVFMKFKINDCDMLTYDPNRNVFDDTTSSRLEQTNIIKDHISYCDWIATTVGPNYRQKNVPAEIKDIFITMITKLKKLVTDENGCSSWITYACNLF